MSKMDPSNFHSISEQEDNAFKRGLDEQRAAYRQASLDSDYPKMARALENMYCEIKPKVHPSCDTEVDQVIQVIDWFYDRPKDNIKRFPNGKKVVVFSEDEHNEIRKRFRLAYRIMNQHLAALRLL